MKFNTTDITTFEDFRIGNADSRAKGTGCTVIVCENGATGGVDVRGGAPATRETDLLRSENTVESVNAVMISGGSVFGLEAASGAARELSERGIGIKFRGNAVPIVCGASLYDLEVGDSKAFPDLEMGKEAVRNAFNRNFKNGNFGAGTGCSVGKAKGIGRAMKTGIGSFACSDGNLEVGAIVAVNAFGDIYNGAGNIIAGMRSEDGKRIFGTIRSFKDMVRDVPYEPSLEDTVVIDTRDIAEAQFRSEHKAMMTEIAEAIREEFRRTSEFKKSDFTERDPEDPQVTEGVHQETVSTEETLVEAARKAFGRHMRRDEAEAEAEKLAEEVMAVAEETAAIEEAEAEAEEMHAAPAGQQVEEAVIEIAEAEEPYEDSGSIADQDDLGYDIPFNTTIGCLVTNAKLTKPQANKLASILHDAFARSIKPVHSTQDGDTIFVLASGRYKVNFDAFAALATDVMQYAIIDGAVSAKPAFGLPSAGDLQDRR